MKFVIIFAFKMFKHFWSQKYIAEEQPSIFW